MKNILIMINFTIRESLARKVFISFLAISVFILLLTAVIFSVTDTQSLLPPADKMGSDKMLEIMVINLEIGIAVSLGNLCILLSIFACASFVPIMLEKGNIDLLLSKPVSRPQLLMGKYLGGLLFVFINILFVVLGVWLIVSLKFSYWNFYFLWIIVTFTFTFSILFSVMVLFGVMTRSSVLGMMTAYIIYFILSWLLFLGKDKLHLLIKNDIVNGIITGLYYFIPKTFELMGPVTNDLASGKSVSDFQPIISSFIFLILMLGSSVYIFNKKDL